MLGFAIRSSLRTPGPAIVVYGIAAAVLAAGFIFDESTCIWRALTGWPCPGCGMGHALIALAQGQVGAAWNYHPASFLVVPILLWNVVRKLRVFSQ